MANTSETDREFWKQDAEVKGSSSFPLPESYTVGKQEATGEEA